MLLGCEGSRITLPGPDSQLTSLGLWTGDFTSLSLCFLICPVGTITSPERAVCAVQGTAPTFCEHWHYYELEWNDRYVGSGCSVHRKDGKALAV